MRWIAGLFMAVVVAGTVSLQAQSRESSPEGVSSTEVGGQWIDITYGRPILRGRTGIFGSGADYGTKVYDGAPVWRAGANASTRIKTAVPLEIGGKRVAPGEYVMLIELKSPKEWTFILTTQSWVRDFDPNNRTDLYGAYNYTPAKDVTRAPMTVEGIPFAIDQLTWGFTDVTPAGGAMRIWWDRTMATVPFKIVK
jgi:hypothetical protein